MKTLLDSDNSLFSTVWGAQQRYPAAAATHPCCWCCEVKLHTPAGSTHSAPIRLWWRGWVASLLLRPSSPPGWAPEPPLTHKHTHRGRGGQRGKSWSSYQTCSCANLAGEPLLADLWAEWVASISHRSLFLTCWDQLSISSKAVKYSVGWYFRQKLF